MAMKRPGVIKQLSNLSIDEVSLVDRGGNQYADVLISKRLEDEVSKADPDQASVSTTGKGKGKKKPALHGQNTRPSEDNSGAPSDENFTSGAPDGEVEEDEDAGIDFQDPGIYKALVEAYGEEEVHKAFPQQYGQYPPPPGQVTPFAAQPMGAGAPAPGPQNFPSGQMPGQAPAPQMPGMPGMAPGGQVFPSPPGQLPGQMQSGPPLPPEVVQYIKGLEAQLAQLSGADKPAAVDQQQQNNSTSQGDKVNPFGKNYDDTLSGDELAFLEELSKSLDDEDTAEAVSKAMEAVSKAEERAQQAEEIAKAERDIRLNAEFIAKAREMSLPVNPAEFGPVLKRLHEQMDPDDVEVITKALSSAGTFAEKAGIFGEIGKMGGGANADVFDSVEAKAAEIAKSSEGLTQEQAFAKALETDPEAYDEYLRNNRR